jgi:phosphoglycolate phosphatase-like HAD superfamily hydrolase
MKAIIMDLDGTLCDASAYLKYGDHAYHEAATTVAPVNPEMVVAINDARLRGEAIIVLSGRSDTWLGASVAWMQEHGVVADRVEFRARGDYRSNRTVKKERLEKLRRYYEITEAYDDDPRNLDMFRNAGIPKVVEVGTWDWRLS